MGKRAENVREFIETYCSIEGGAPLPVEEWQMDFLKAVYPGRPGAKRKVTRGILSTGRKNSKTTFIAGICLAHIVGPEAKPGTSVRAVATSWRQAGFLFKAMRRMVEAHPQLAKRIEIKVSTKSMICLNNGVEFETLTSRASTSQGDNVAFWVYDELAQASSLDLFDSLEKSQGAVSGGGLGLVMSTFSDDPGNPLADLINMVDVGQAVGEMGHWHKALYTADPEADPFDWENIKRANPNLGVSLSVESVEKEIMEAKAMPSRRAKFKTYRLNLNAGNFAALCDPMVWRDAAFKGPKTQAQWLADLRGEQVTVGLDLSDTRDLTAAGLWFEGAKFVAADSWLPRDALVQREQEDRVPYREWAEAGHLRTIPGPVIRHEVICDRLEEIAKDYALRSLRYDRYRMAPVLQRLEARHVAIEAIEFGQGYRDMAPAIEWFENRLLSGELFHASNPVLTMAVLNCRVMMNPTSISDERKPWRVSKHHRIDPIVAVLMAGAPRDEEPPTTAASLVPLDLVEGEIEDFLPPDDLPPDADPG